MNHYILSIKHSSPNARYYYWCCERYSQTYDLFNVSKLESYLKKQICAYINIFESTYLISSVNVLVKTEIMDIIKPREFLLLTIDIKNYYGYLNEEYWKWINKIKVTDQST